MKNLLIVLSITLIASSCNHADKGITKRQPDSALAPAVIDKETADGLIAAKWSYYWYYAAEQPHYIDPLENYSIHPTLFNLEMMQHTADRDTIKYRLRKRFTSSKRPCIDITDSVEIAINRHTKVLYSITEYGRDYNATMRFLGNLFDDKSLVKRVDSFLDLHEHEINPWFRDEAIARGLLKH